MKLDDALSVWEDFRGVLGDSVNVQIPATTNNILEVDIGPVGWRGYPRDKSKLSLYFLWMRKVKALKDAGIDLDSNSTSVVDIGCGNGMFASLVGTDTYLGLDLVDAHISRCKKAFPNRTFVKLDFKNGLYGKGTLDPINFKIPRDDNSVHAIMCNSLFTHIGQPAVVERYLGEMDRVLVKGGCAYTTWFRSPPNELDDGDGRTVYLESDIVNWLSRWEKVSATEGETTQHDDQWETLYRKIK